MERKSYSLEFKKEVISQSYKVSSIKEFARELDINISLLHTWRREAPVPLNDCLQEIKRLKLVVKEQAFKLEILEKGRLSNLQTNKETYQFIEDNKSLFPIKLMCKTLKVSDSCYYRWKNLGDKVLNKRELDNQKYTPIIKGIFERSRRTYGSPRIKVALERLGYPISRMRVHRIMVANGLQCKVNRKFKKVLGVSSVTSNSENLLQQNFSVKRLNEVWVSDMTYISTKRGWIYLTTIIDLYNREIIGWSLSKRRTAITTTIPAWQKALNTRKVTQPLIFHSDRGIEYTCNLFRNALKANPLITQSMSRRGNCWDNVVAESFFKTFKYELNENQSFKSMTQARVMIIEYINWYNTERLHSSLGYKTPCEVS